MEINTLILLRYFEGKTSAREESEIENWLAGDADGSRAKKFKDARYVFEGMTVHGAEMAHAKASASYKRPTFLKRMTGWTAAAAAMALIVLATARIVRNNTLDAIAENMETVYVPSGKTMELTLEDGTHLWLNSGTRIEYPSVFGRKSRNVKVLRGEVLFDVTRDENRPFTVSTFASDVKVLGTKFDVLADEELGLFKAALMRGAVSVSSHLDAKDVVVLRPSQEVRMEDGRLLVSEIVDPQSVICWADGLVNIADVPFDMLMKRFERAYNVKIDVERAEMPVIRYSRGKVRVSDGIDHALDMLSKASDFTWSHDHNTNVITIR